MKRVLLQLIFAFILIGSTYGQTLIMNEVSQGTTGNMEYVEFVVVDTTVTYDCLSGTPPTIDIRGWIYDDNSGYHGAGGVASGCIRFAFHPTWQAVPLGTIILIYNDAAPDPSIPPADLTLSDGDCRIVAPISDPNLFESNATTPGAVACSYPAIGWTPGGNWSNLLLANPGDCARIVDLSGCEVFSVCYGSANLNTLIYFQNGAELPNDHRNSVYYFNDGDPDLQSNWSIGCSDNEVVLDANLCGSDMQTPGAPNNAANAAFIAQFNNGCTPIPPIGATALVDAHEQCGCDGQATATGSGSIGPYTYEWFDATMTSISQTGSTATALCPGTYFVTITSSIDCDITQSITINPGTGTPAFSVSAADPSACGILDGTITLSGLNPGTLYSIDYTFNGTPSGAISQTSNGSGDIVLNGLGSGTYSNFSVTLNGCTGVNGVSLVLVDPVAPTVQDLADQTVCDSYTLPAISGTGLSGSEGYFTAPNGGGTQLAVGTSVTAGQTLYIYAINGACFDEETVVINVNYTPSIDPIANVIECETYTLPAITGTNMTGSESFYNNSQAMGGTVITGPITSSQTVWVYDADGSCSDETSFVVTIDPLPVVTAVTGGGDYCVGDVLNDIEVTVTGSNDWTIEYTLDGIAQTTTQSTSPISLGNVPGVYMVTGVTDANCTNSASGTQTIVVSPIPAEPTAGTDSLYCSSWTLTDMTVSGTGGTYTWYSNDQLTLVLGTGSTMMPIQVNGTNYYYVTETVNGCASPADTVSITIQDCEIIVPTAFTPNGDGVHDTWEIVDLDDVYPNNVVTVYNRWGNMIYQSEEGNYSGKPWDGTYEGNALPVASYYFVIDYNDDSIGTAKGIVTIILKD